MQPTPLLYPWLLSVTLTFLTGLYAFRYRRHVAAIPFILMCFFASFWALCYIFELGATSLEL
ncbi:MAG TPA: histidine kinase N-terminal 7TM domain-containing protein, partial [Anaerolineales bacterium]|nr:histidine kinase N-terminal 7TM domain-containing protein [Anaerolineales bacterium]